MNVTSLKLRTFLEELSTVGSIPKDHSFVSCLDFEEKYELIKMESKSWLKIENGVISTDKKFNETRVCYSQAS